MELLRLEPRIKESLRHHVVVFCRLVVPALHVALLIGSHPIWRIESVDRARIDLDRRRMRKAGLRFDVLQALRRRHPIVVLADQDQQIACRLPERILPVQPAP